MEHEGKELRELRESHGLKQVQVAMEAQISPSRLCLIKRRIEPVKKAILTNFPTQADFAQEVKVSETLLSKIIKKRRSATVEQKNLFAKTLRTNVNELFPD